MVRAVFDSSLTQLALRGRISRSYSSQVWLLCSAALLLLVIAMRWLLSVHPFPGDAWTAQLAASPKPWFVNAFTRAYQQIGRPLVAIGEVLVMIPWLWRTGGRRAAQGLLIALLASATCGLIKTICGPTPLWLALHHLGTNFPSGVVTFVTATGGYLGAVAWQQGRRLIPGIVILVIAGAGPARVLGGEHLLSDVVGGYLVGAAWLIVANVYFIGTSQGAEEKEASWKIDSLEAVT